jgi:ParB-like chromosome segregation protein Spo0J
MYPGPLNTLLGFELETYQIPLDQLLPSKKVPDGVMSTRKYKQIVSSINEVGLIEPLSFIQPDRKKPEHLVLDGHLRVLALKELGMSVGPACSPVTTKVSVTTSMSTGSPPSPSTT